MIGKHDRPVYDQVCDCSNPPFAKGFAGGQINLIERVQAPAKVVAALGRH